MILRGYFWLCILGLIIGLFCLIVFKINKKKNNLIFKIAKATGIIYTILLFLATTGILIYGSYTKRVYMIIFSSFTFLSIGFFFLSSKIKSFRIFGSDLGYFFSVFGVISFAIVLIVGRDPNEFVQYSNGIYSVDIKKSDVLKQTINIHGFNLKNLDNVFYLKVNNDARYYYELEAENGELITEEIDLIKNYVEKIEDEKYENNPHIEVYVEEIKYMNWYDEEIVKQEDTKYYIYVPKSSTIYY